MEDLSRPTASATSAEVSSLSVAVSVRDAALSVRIDGADSANPVTIAEVGSGRYSFSFDADADAYWAVTIRHATHNERGWFEDFHVSGGAADAGGDSWAAVEAARLKRERAKERIHVEILVDDPEEISIIAQTLVEAYYLSEGPLG